MPDSGSKTFILNHSKKAASLDWPPPLHEGRQRFIASLNDSHIMQLQGLRSDARRSPSQYALPWWCGKQLMGYLPRTHVAPLLQVLPGAHADANCLRWNSWCARADDRSRYLESALVQLRKNGLLRGWRNERFSFWSHEALAPQTAGEDFVHIERAGFLFLGMLSHAVHINGFTPDGHLWCGQRSATKATDPGLWDNLSAGGLPTGESLLDCAARELWEEAGLVPSATALLQAAGSIRISQASAGGWHDEVLHVYNLPLPEGFAPRNQDGEVQAFAKFSAPAVMERIAAGQFTSDAALAIAQGLLAAHSIP